MDHRDAMRLEILDMLMRGMAGGFHHLDPALDDGAAVFGIGRRAGDRHEGEVHAKGLVGKGTCRIDRAAQIIRRG